MQNARIDRGGEMLLVVRSLIKAAANLSSAVRHQATEREIGRERFKENRRGVR